MKIGIISVAHMHAYSYAHAVKQLDGVELVGITDEVAERGEKAAQQFGTQYVPDLQQFLSMDMDAVMICTENAKHLAAATAAAKAGKHILCEKPIATTVEDAWKMIKVCQEHQVILQTAFPVRYSAPVLSVKKMLENEELGRILAIRGTNRGQNPGGWFVDQSLSGGGAVLDHTVHVIDLMRWFMKSEVKEVYAEVDTRFNEIETDDCGLLTLEFENGVIASHDPSWSRSKSFPTWGDVTMEIIGTDGVVRLDAFAQHMMLYSDQENRVSQQFWGNDMDYGLVADFVKAVREQKEPSITGEDGLRAMEVALAAYQSAQTKQPVRLR